MSQTGTSEVDFAYVVQLAHAVAEKETVAAIVKWLRQWAPSTPVETLIDRIERGEWKA